MSDIILSQVTAFYELMDQLDGPSSEPTKFCSYLVEEGYTVSHSMGNVSVYLQEDQSSPESPAKFGYSLTDVATLPEDGPFTAVLTYISLSHSIARNTVAYVNEH